MVKTIEDVENSVYVAFQKVKDDIVEIRAQLGYLDKRMKGIERSLSEKRKPLKKAKPVSKTFKTKTKKKPKAKLKKSINR